MTRTRTRLALVGIALVLAASALPPSGGTAAAAEHTFVVEQGSQCYEVSPLRGSEDVASFYDYRNVENHDGPGQYTYSTFMPGHLTREDASRLFLYEGPDGVSLVMVHNEKSSNRDAGSAVTFRFSGLPSGGDWVVEDDDYSNQDDRFSRNRIDWSFYGDRTDGAAFRGLDRGGTEVTVDPAFDEEAALYDSPVDRSGNIRAWQFLTGSLGDPSAVSLDPNRPVTIRTGHCGPDETPPDAALSVGDGVAGHPVTFDARGSSDDRGVTEYRWDFDGDGEVDRTTNDPTVEHTFEETGTYDATVTVVDEGENADAASAQVAVEADDPPNAAFAVGDSPTEGFPVTLDASNSSDELGVTEYRWDFDGDGEVDHESGDPTVSHAFEAAGEHEVALTVVDAGGQNATATRTVSVGEDSPPEAAVRVASPEVPVEGEEVVLSASNSTDDTGIAEYRWSLGEDVTATGERVAHTFDGNGTFEVTLTVVDEGGNNATTTADVEVLPPDETPPDAAVAANRTTVEAGVPVGFAANESSDDRRVAGYEWDFGDGAAATGRTATHAYGSAGNYTATVVVADGGGNRDAANVTVEVTPADPPNVTATVPEAVAVGQSFEVSGSASDRSGVAAYRWDFAGAERSGERVSFAFEETGTYEVTLTAIDRGGHADSVTREIEVNAPDEAAPTAELSVGTNETKTGTAVEFDASNSTDEGWSGVAEYRWDFDGDGEVDRRTGNATVTKEYGSSGTYNATVVVADGGNNTDEATVQIRVKRGRQAHRGSGNGGSAGGGSTDLGPPPVDTDTEERGPNAGVVDVRNARGDETIRADLPATDAAAESDVRFRSVAVDLAGDDPHFVVETERTPADSSAGASVPADVTLGALSVGAKYVEPGQVERVTYEVAVERSRLADAGLAPADLHAYQRTGGEGGAGSADGAGDAWERANLSVAETGETVVLRVRADAFAPVALGADEPVTVADVELAGSEVTADEPVAVTATLRNEGDGTGEFTANLTADGEAVATKTVEVPAGETKRVTVEATLPPGTHEIALDGRSVGTVTVTEPAADLAVVDVSLNESAVAAGERVAITATVENAGSADGERTVALTLFGEQVATKTVAVPAGETEQVTFVRSVDAAGTYTATVGNESATLEVNDDGGGNDDGPAGPDVPVPGFGVGAAVAALVAALLVVRRRR